MRRKVLVALALLPVWMIVGEVAVRGLLAVSGEAYDSTQARDRLLGMVSAMNDPVPEPHDVFPEELRESGHAIHPYIGWDGRDGEALLRQLALLEKGALEPGGAGFEVLVVGGSVAQLTARLGGPRIAKVLGDDPRIASRPAGVRLLNHGRGSFKQPQQVMLVSWLFGLGIVPDVVLNVDGFNEAALGRDNLALGTHPLAPHWMRWGFVSAGVEGDEVHAALVEDVRAIQAEARAAADRTIERGYLRSAVLGKAALAAMAGRQRAWTSLQDEIVARLAGDPEDPLSRREPWEGDVDEAMAEVARGWGESSRILRAMCEVRGVTYVHVLQPTLHDEGSKPLTAEEIRRGAVKETWVEGVRLGYPLLRAEGERLAREGLAFVDGSRAFAGLETTTYYDSCHFRGAGMMVFATLCADAIADALPD